MSWCSGGRRRRRSDLFPAVGTGLLLAIVALTPQPAAAQSIELPLNDNQSSALAAIQNVCPQLGTLVGNRTATAAETALFIRCNRVLQATEGVGRPQAVQALTAEEANAARTNTIEFGAAARTTIVNRLATLRAAGAGATLASLEHPGQLSFPSRGGASGDEASFSDGRLGVYLQSSFGSGDKDPTPFEAGYDVDTFSLVGGVDYRFTDSLVAGAALTYAEAESDFTRDSTGTAIGGNFDSDGISLSLYSSWYGERSYVDLIASYGNVDFESNRTIVYTVEAGNLTVGDVTLPTIDAVNRVARGRTSGDTLSVGLGAGMNFGRGAWTFGPLVAINYLDLSVDGFSESGADELNLLYSDQSAQSLQLQLGLNLAYAASLTRGVVVPYARVVFVNEQKEDQDSFRLQYLSDPCARADSGVPSCSFFDVESDEPDTNFMLWSVGLSAVLGNNLSSFLNYTAISGMDSISFGEFTIGLRYQFR